MLSGQLLPIHLKPKKDEIFSSWLARLCLENTIKPHSFCNWFWRGKEIWTRDTDRLYDPCFIEDLSRLTGTSQSAIESTLLQSYESILFERLYSSLPNRFIRVSKRYHRKSLLMSMLYCPQCLEEDEKPYFRKHWRTSIYPYCLIHSKLMVDSCQQCGSSINYYKIDITKAHIAYCLECGSDLRETKTNNHHTFSDTFLQAIYKASLGGRFRFQVLNLSPIQAFSGFDILLKNLLSKSSNIGVNLQTTINKKQAMPLPIVFPSKYGIQAQTPIENYYTWKYVEYLLSNYPENLIDIFTNVKWFRSRIKGDFSSIPSWLDRHIKRHLTGGL